MTDQRNSYQNRNNNDRNNSSRDDRGSDRRGGGNFNRDDRGGDRRNSGGDRSKQDAGNFRGRKQFTGGGQGSNNDRQQIITPRRGAFYLLEAVLVDKRPLDFTEHNILKQVNQRDRGLTRMIAYTALRHNSMLDAMIDHFVDDEIGTPQVRIFLKVGITQILFMDTADHAAVNETLNSVFGKSEPSKGMMNAIFRRTIAEGKDFIDGHTDLVSVPKFLWRSWVAAYGEKTSRLILEAHESIAPIDISVKSNPELWAEKLDGMVLPSGGIRIGNPGKITDLEGYEEGDWWVQDFAAQIPVTLFGDDLTGQTIIDLCAAPGGKTAQLLARGAKVIAVDHNEYRLQRLHENMARLNLTENLEVVISDAVKYKPDALVDGILLDAPCSATGTIRKHPDLPFLKDTDLIMSVAKLQLHMLAKAGEMLKPGGTLVFATCSMQPEEGENHLLNVPENLKRKAIRRREVEGMHQILTPKGVIRTLPHMFSEEGGMDGFFIARFEKV